MNPQLWRILATAFFMMAPFAVQAEQEAPPQGFTPHVATEIDMGLYSSTTTRATDPMRRGTSLFLFGDIGAAFHVTPNFSIQTVFMPEPVGRGDATGGFPNGGVMGFRHQALVLETFTAEWKPDDALRLYVGHFLAPFGRGHEDFPGIFTKVRAHEIELIENNVGIGGTWTVLADPRFGEHDLSAALFSIDRSYGSSTWITSHRCCNPRYERYDRTTAAQGGPGNNGQVNSFAIALDGDKFDFLPDFSYHLATVSRAAGTDGTAREWGYVAALRYEIPWTQRWRTLFFGEAVRFTNFEGRPYDASGSIVSARRDFSTLGAQNRLGEWRSTLAWQQDQIKSRPESLPTENFYEVSIGRDLGAGFGLDIGYQYGRQTIEDTGKLGSTHAVLARLGWRGGH